MTPATLIASLALAAWLYMIFARGMFWMARERDDRDQPATTPASWPSVVAVVPARNEADVITRTLGSLLAQDYPGDFRVILVDDNSTDGTGEAARDAPSVTAQERAPRHLPRFAGEDKPHPPPFFRGEGDPEGVEGASAATRLTVIIGEPLPPGWTGKLWAVRQGVEAAASSRPKYLLLTDADIAHSPDNVRLLVQRAEAAGLVLTSLMARLTVQTWAERLMIPAFVFFFDMLYPFAWVNDPRRSTAAAAGGCMLARRDALEAAGGIEAIAHAIIDDCALGARMKTRGPIWLGLTERARSLRPYSGFSEIGRMVSRSAYAQLGFSPWLLAGTVLGMILVYLAAPVLAVVGDGPARWIGLAAWLAMAFAYQPMLRFYRQSPLLGLALPAIGALYTVFTLRSAIDVWRGRGGMWKGRSQALAPAR